MKVELREKTKSCLFGSLAKGDTFIHYNHVYIKTEAFCGEEMAVNVVDLVCGEPDIFSEDDEVELVHGSFVCERV